MSADTRTFLAPQGRQTPAGYPPSEGENGGMTGDAGGVVDFDAVLDAARRNHRCAECGTELERWRWASVQFCGSKCRYRFRDRRKYAEDPERERAKVAGVLRGEPGEGAREGGGR